MIDVWSSAGVRLPRLLAPRDGVPLPMDEVVFLGMSRENGFNNTIQTARKSSLLAEMVRLNHILQQINDFNIRVAESQLNSVAIFSDLENLSSQLDRWLDELPDHIRDTRENLERFAALGLGRVFWQSTWDTITLDKCFSTAFFTKTHSRPLRAAGTMPISARTTLVDYAILSTHRRQYPTVM